MTAIALTTPQRLLGIDDLAAGDFAALLDLAAVMKRHPLAWRSALEGRAVACLFEHPSTRSRVSLEVAVHRLGALPVVLAAVGGSTRRRHRPLAVVVLRRDRGSHGPPPGPARARRARVGAGHQRAHRSRAPVPGARRLPHVARALRRAARAGDRVGRRRRAGDAFADRGRATGGLHVRLAAPPALRPDPALLARAGGAIRVCDTPREAVSGAVAVYAATPRRELPDAYTVTPELLSFAAPGALVLHATPTAEQATNLLPAEQAVLRALVGGDWEAGDPRKRAAPAAVAGRSLRGFPVSGPR